MDVVSLQNYPSQSRLHLLFPLILLSAFMACHFSSFLVYFLPSLSVAFHLKTLMLSMYVSLISLFTIYWYRTIVQVIVRALYLVLAVFFLSALNDESIFQMRTDVIATGNHPTNQDGQLYHWCSNSSPEIHFPTSIFTVYKILFKNFYQIL